jgi:hypothetical protein
MIPILWIQAMVSATRYMAGYIKGILERLYHWIIDNFLTSGVTVLEDTSKVLFSMCLIKYRALKTYGK